MESCSNINTVSLSHECSSSLHVLLFTCLACTIRWDNPILTLWLTSQDKFNKDGEILATWKRFCWWRKGSIVYLLRIWGLFYTCWEEVAAAERSLLSCSYSPPGFKWEFLFLWLWEWFWSSSRLDNYRPSAKAPLLFPSGQSGNGFTYLFLFKEK